MFVNKDRLADQVGIFVEPAFPKLVTQYCYRMSTGCAIVVLCKKSTGPGTNFKHFEKVSTDELTAHALRLVAIADVHLRAGARNHTSEDRIVIAQILIHRIRK